MDTLASLNKSWISKIESAGIFVLIAGLPLAVIVSFLDLADLPVATGMILIVSFALTMIHYVCIYNLVKCPSCGQNLSKFKNGKNIPIKQLYNGFKKGAACRHCKWQPNNGI